MLVGTTSSLFRLAASALVVALIGIARPAEAQQNSLEPAIKATFVVRFASFVTWPTSAFRDAADPLAICVAGDDDFATLVEEAARDERVGLRKIVVYSFDALPGEASCHVVYAAGAPGQAVGQMLAAVEGQPTLTVTDERRGGERGMVHFVLDQGRVRFLINRDATDAVGLAVNSRLLSVALSVHSRRSP